jgi:hypothetical protein
MPAEANTGDNRGFPLLMIDALLTARLRGRDSRRSYNKPEGRIMRP